MIGMFLAHFCVVWAESLVSLQDIQEGVLVPVPSNISLFGYMEATCATLCCLGSGLMQVVLTGFLVLL